VKSRQTKGGARRDRLRALQRARRARGRVHELGRVRRLRPGALHHTLAAHLFVSSLDDLCSLFVLGLLPPELKVGYVLAVLMTNPTIKESSSTYLYLAFSSVGALLALARACCSRVAARCARGRLLVVLVHLNSAWPLFLLDNTGSNMSHLLYSPQPVYSSWAGLARLDLARPSGTARVSLKILTIICASHTRAVLTTPV
jgi:hypothetical protein